MRETVKEATMPAKQADKLTRQVVLKKKKAIRTAKAQPRNPLRSAGHFRPIRTNSTAIIGTKVSSTSTGILPHILLSEKSPALFSI